MRLDENAGSRLDLLNREKGKYKTKSDAGWRELRPYGVHETVELKIRSHFKTWAARGHAKEYLGAGLKQSYIVDLLEAMVCDRVPVASRIRSYAL